VAITTNRSGSVRCIECLLRWLVAVVNTRTVCSCFKTRLSQLLKKLLSCFRYVVQRAVLPALSRFRMPAYPLDSRLDDMDEHSQIFWHDWSRRSLAVNSINFQQNSIIIAHARLHNDQLLLDMQWNSLTCRSKDVVALRSMRTLKVSKSSRERACAIAVSQSWPNVAFLSCLRGHSLGFISCQTAG
jgi:hypothetical protein